jgi:RND family efflux transporter MFP subunit
MTANKLNELKIEREPEREPRALGWLWLVLALLVVAAVAAWWWMRPPEALVVRTGTARLVSSQAANTVLNASGYVTARRQATVSSKVTGQVREVLIEEGMDVKAGDVMARLDDTNIRATFNLANAQLVATRTARKETAALIEEANANLARTETLVERQLASQSALDRDRAAARALAARQERLGAEVQVAERQVDIYRQQLEDTIIRAPFDGVVVAKNAQPGDMMV